jgi:NitT/TauT family transport system permease protein
VTRWIDRAWLAVVVLAGAWAVWTIVRYLTANLRIHDLLLAFGLGFLTLARVLILIAIASLIWVPIGVWIGLRPVWSQRIQPVAQFLAAFPAIVIFPFVVMGIVAARLDPNIWLSPLIILGTQWYILFNVVAGASALPNDLKEAAGIFHLRSWQRWRDFILPGIFPYYVTGALTASGGSWNASVVAEVVSWGHTRLQAEGLGAFGRRRLSPRGPRRQRDERLRHSPQSLGVAADVRLCREEPSLELNLEDSDHDPHSRTHRARPGSSGGGDGPEARVRPWRRRPGSRRARGRQPDLATERDRRPARPFRIRQIHAAALHRRPDHSHRRKRQSQ